MKVAARAPTSDDSNEELFERYRREVTEDRQRPPGPSFGIPGWDEAMRAAGVWGARYDRRRSALGAARFSTLRPADQIACKLLPERNRRADAEVPDLPDLDPVLGALVENIVRNYAEAPLGAPHAYGPSLRRLYVEARQNGSTNAEAWQQVEAWGNRTPPAFGREAERQRRKQPPLGAEHFRLEQRVDWTSTADPQIPWEAAVDGANWQVRLNDFPDETMYSLLIQGAEIGDFQEWPAAWGRDGQAAVAIPAGEAQGQTSLTIIGLAASNWPARYAGGAHEQVWAEMVALGPEVQTKAYLEPAQVVARETMRRARANVETLLQRLNRMGYQFWEPAVGRRWWRPDNDERKLVQRLQRAGLALPLSLLAWLEELGHVDFNGSHPTLAQMEGQSGFQGFYADPLMVAPDPGWLAEEWEAAQEAGEDGFELSIGWDDAGKAGLFLDAQVDRSYTVFLPNAAADAPLLHEWHGTTFVDYLRRAFRAGGFPGWERYPQRPEKELALLRDGLLEL